MAAPGHNGHVTCLACGGQAEIKDREPRVVRNSLGWATEECQILVECKACGTVRLYLEQSVRLDQGDFGKRSLR